MELYLSILISGFFGLKLRAGEKEFWRWGCSSVIGLGDGSGFEGR